MSIDPNAAGAMNPPKKKSWLIWLVPLILIILGTPVLCCGGCIYWGWSTIAAPRDAALAALNKDQRVTDKLGSPLKVGNSISVSNLQSNNGSGSATIDFNVSGPNGTAQVSGQMTQTSGTWSPSILTVTFSDGSSLTVPE